MSAIGGPNIVENGLVLSYDAANIKSFRGEPTINLIPNADIMTNWITYYRTQSLSTFTTEFGTIGYRFIRQPSWNGIFQGFNLVNTGVYTFSARFKYLGGSVNNNGATVYISNYGGGDTAAGLDKSKIGVWQKISHTVNVTSPSNVLFSLISYGGIDNGTGDPDFSSWEVTQPQIEFKPYSTPFVNGTRGSTVATGGGLIDQSGNANNGELINGVTFDSNNLGSLVFDGIDDTILTNVSTFGNNTTWIAWVNRTSTPNYYNMFMGRILPYFGVTSDNGIIFSNIIGGSQQTVFASSVSSSNNWLHLSFTTQFDGTNTTMRIYLNGNLVASNTFSGAQGNGGLGFFEIGDGQSGTSWYPFNGKISTVKIYNKTLDISEIQQNYNATKSRYL